MEKKNYVGLILNVRPNLEASSIKLCHKGDIFDISVCMSGVRKEKKKLQFRNLHWDSLYQQNLQMYIKDSLFVAGDLNPCGVGPVGIKEDLFYIEN